MVLFLQEIRTREEIMTDIKVLFVLIIALRGAVGDTYVIHNASELVEFSNLVNSGQNSFTGATVTLDNDIYFTKNAQGSQPEFNPIGNDTSPYQFRGIFDGEGHVIVDLIFNTSQQFAGLFGHSSYGMTIRNVVLDESCSITSTYGSNNVYAGGLIGYCYAGSTYCNIENNINVGDVTFRGDFERVHCVPRRDRWGYLFITVY